MKEEEKSINIRLNDYGQKGLYLHFQDLSRLVLTREVIERTANEFWQDSAKIPPGVKKAREFQRCPHCPLKGENDLCDAIRPVLPFLEKVDKYISFDRVTAVYRGEHPEVLHISDTNMQNALRYVSILSPMFYCQGGRKYWKYFFEVIPLGGAKAIASRIYLNMYRLHNGKKKEIDKVIAGFKEQTRISTQNQVKRLNMLCKNDTFLNAFVNTHIITDVLSMDMDKVLDESFKNF